MSKQSQTSNKEETLKLSPQWPYRLFGTVVVLGLIMILCMVTITIKNQLISKQIEAIKDDFYLFTSKHGFLIDDIVIVGRNRSTKEELYQAIALDRENNILQVNLDDIRKKIEKLPWVKNAVVKRNFFPNIIHISLEEKEIGAVWQNHEKFYPLDFDGNIINADFRSDVPLLLIVGEKAPENVKKLLSSIYDKNKKYHKRVKVANFISGRRWDLILDDIENGITIKLPEDNMEKAWQKLLKLNETKGILKRKLTIIDLRLPDKVIVKLKKHPAGTTHLNKNKEHNL